MAKVYTDGGGKAWSLTRGFTDWTADAYRYFPTPTKDTTIYTDMNNGGKALYERVLKESELLRLIEVGASCFNHYCISCIVTQLNVLHNVHRRMSSANS